MKTSSGSEKSHQYTHEYVYHHKIIEDVSSNNNFPQSYPSSPKCPMKFLQHQMNQVSSNKDHESSNDSNGYHRCIHVDVHHQKVTRNGAENLNKNVLQMICNVDQYNHLGVLSSHK